MYFYTTSECPKDTYGPGCRNRCYCLNQALCDPIGGVCICAPGFYGISCEKQCPEGFFGIDCQKKCACRPGEVCDHVTGKCTCPFGQWGVDCKERCQADAWVPQCEEVRLEAMSLKPYMLQLSSKRYMYETTSVVLVSEQWQV